MAHVLLNHPEEKQFHMDYTSSVNLFLFSIKWMLFPSGFIHLFAQYCWVLWLVYCYQSRIVELEADEIGLEVSGIYLTSFVTIRKVLRFIDY